jgi:AcrR family transcriptional regulator
VETISAISAGLPPKQWQQRAALRSGGRSGDAGGRDFAMDIIDAAWSLVQQEEILDFTVRQVVDRADVALQTFYRYFGNKDELLLAMLEESMRAAAEVVLALPFEDPVERLRYLVTAPIVMDFDERAQRVTRWRGRERQRLLEFFPDAVEAVYEPYRATIAEAIMAVCEAGRGSCDAPDIDAKLILHLVQEMAHGVHGGGIEDGAELVAARVWHLVRAGLAAPTERAAEAADAAEAARAAPATDRPGPGSADRTKPLRRR